MSDQSRVDSPAPGPFTPMELDNNSSHESIQNHPNHDYQSSPLNTAIKQEPAAASSSNEAVAPAPMDHSRLDVETDGREKNLAEFLAMMDNYTPIIPDAVTDYYLSRTGFDCDDVRIKRLLALAAQKFVADIATDAFQYCKVRQSGNRRTGKERKTVLTMEDLSTALAEYGVNVKKPDYYS
ncbi:transcription initiation factor IID TAF10 subunit [Phycomyces nitens]|nr:transcription initiation factor IID TAF10 subunit [Phycomyces nitens]